MQVVPVSSMASVFKTWSGDEWQEHIAMLLKRHYAPGQFQEIPDKHRGDAGLEGFTNDGCAYQCYSPEEPLEIAGRLDAHKRKIYRDIQKFCKNHSVLTQLLGQTKIKCWILVVPIFDSKDTIAYGETQAAEVRKLSLPYVDAGFCIRIITDDQFAVEREQLMGVGLAKVRIQPTPPVSAEVEQWLANNSDFVRVLDGKLARMKPKASAEKRNELRGELITHFVNGQNAIALLHENHGELYEKVVQLKEQHEQFLITESMTATGLPTEILQRTVTAYGSKLESELLGVDSHTAKILVWEAIADWLLRCPLDFEEAA